MHANNSTLLHRVHKTHYNLLLNDMGHFWLTSQIQFVKLYSFCAGLLKFKSPVVASTLTSISSVVNEVDLKALLTSAWYIGQQITISVPTEFQGPVVFQVRCSV